MKTVGMITMAAMIGGCAWAAARDDGTRIAVCVEVGTHATEVNAAATVASRIFKPAGVELEWHTDRFCQTRHDQPILVSLSTDTPGTILPGALAYARPYDGVHIQVFYDRILRADPALLPTLLAHVIVHEITHILQGVGQHSDNGIMKARWSTNDYIRMKRGQLGFTDVDIKFIHDGLAARAVRPAAETLVAAAR